MSINTSRLQQTIKEMNQLYQANPEVAVRGQAFIKILHNYCIYELSRLGIKNKKVIIHRRSFGEVTVKPEGKILGLHKPKDVDVVVFHNEVGPLIAISIRSQMSSIDKNFINYYEGIIGDVISLHDRYPNLVIGEIYLLPLHNRESNTDPWSKGKKHNLETKEELFRKIANRRDEKDRVDKYEHLAFIVVDFSKNPPVLYKDIPKDKTLKIDNFFDKLFATYKERNPFLELI